MTYLYSHCLWHRVAWRLTKYSHQLMSGFVFQVETFCPCQFHLSSSTLISKGHFVFAAFYVQLIFLTCTFPAGHRMEYIVRLQLISSRYGTENYRETKLSKREQLQFYRLFCFLYLLITGKNMIQ